MIAQEKAKVGVWLLKQAVLDLVGQHEDGVKSSDIRDELGLRSPDNKGGRKDNLAWGVMNLLLNDNLIEKKNVDGRTRFFLIAKSPSQE
jgi:hypothetical protein